MSLLRSRIGLSHARRSAKPRGYYSLNALELIVQPSTPLNVTAKVYLDDDPVLGEPAVITWYSNTGTFTDATTALDAQGEALVEFTPSASGDTFHEIVARDQWGRHGRITVQTATTVPTNIAISGPSSVEEDTPSTVYTITSKDSGGATRVVTQNTVLALTSDAVTGEFTSDAEGTTPITEVTILSGQSTASFYYNDTEPAVGVELTAARTSGDGVGSANFFVTITAAPPAEDWQLDAGHFYSDPTTFPLTVVHPRPDNETETYARHRWACPGEYFDIPIGVMFGAWPKRYEMVSGPAWLDIVAETLEFDGDNFIIPEGYGILAGTAPATPQDPVSVTVRVYDQLHGRPSDSYVDVTFTVTVNVSNFVFLDPVNGNDGTADGTKSLPYKELATLMDSDLHGGKICYVRETGVGGYAPNPPRQFRMGTANEPRSYIGYPGETVVINCAGQTGFSNGRSPDNFFWGMTVANVNQNASALNTRAINRVGGASTRLTVGKMICDNLDPGSDADDNTGFLIQPDEGGLTGSNYIYFVDNIGQNTSAAGSSNGPALCQIMNGHFTLQERNRAVAWESANTGILAHKHDSYDGEIRANDCSQAGGTGADDVVVQTGDPTGTSARLLMRHNKCAVGIAVAAGSAGPQTYIDTLVVARNSIQAPTVTWGKAIDNACVVDNDLGPAPEGNVIVGSGANGLDANFNLAGTARANLGTLGAEVA